MSDKYDFKIKEAKIRKLKNLGYLILISSKEDKLIFSFGRIEFSTFKINLMNLKLYKIFRDDTIFVYYGLLLRSLTRYLNYDGEGINLTFFDKSESFYPYVLRTLDSSKALTVSDIDLNWKLIYQDIEI